MKMVERVARVLRECTKRNGGKFRGDEDTGWRDYVDDARAVIAAMSEPDDKMLEAAVDVDVAAGVEHGGREYWTAMIKAAANE